MKKYKIALTICSLLIALSLHQATACPPVSSDRCNVPPFYSSDMEPPNILFVVDVSGSMGWRAYRSSEYQGNEEGYFIPDKYYYYDSGDSTWKETNVVNLPSWGGTVYHSPDDPNDICPDDPGDITYYREQSNANGRYTFKGACLNVQFMSRTDVARWAITGGRPKGCSDVDDDDCDPELSSACDSTAGVCILEPYQDYGYIQVPMSRITGFVQSAKDLELKPRMGALFYSSSIKSNKVYIGDYDNSGNTPGVPLYTNLIKYLNAMDPGGGTGTLYAMEETLDYFKQSDDHDVAGYDFSIAPGTWKDPMYRCDSSGANCEPAGWCTKNFVILLSDGQWNTPSCQYDDDPVVPAHEMHTSLNRTINGHAIDVEKVYTVGLFMGGTGVNSMQQIAIFGAYDDSDDNGWPGEISGYPTDSCNVDDCSSYGSGSSCATLPDPTSTEWDKDQDGLPDTFFAPQNALALKASLFSIFEDIISEVGSSASVATVTQNVLGQDVVLRGAFRHNPPDNRYWEGHLEAYWPDPECHGITTEDECTNNGCSWDSSSQECLSYSFQLDQNSGKFCSDPGYVGGHCWDAHETLATQASRTIFTYIDGQKIEISEQNAALLQPLLQNQIDFDDDGDIDLEDTKQLIRWVHGEWDSNWALDVRARSGLLGDIVFSAPVVIGEPSLASVPQKIALESCSDFSPCSEHLTQDACTGDTDNKCMWDPNLNYCLSPACNAFDDEDSCNDQPLCEWSSSDGSCHQKSAEEICSVEGAGRCFFTYRACNIHRDKVVVVGANDGMLHAFKVGFWAEDPDPEFDNDGDGEKDESKWIYDPDEVTVDGHDISAMNDIGKELWAYIPSNFLSEMACLADVNYGKEGGCHHRTMVDLSSMAWDVLIQRGAGSCSGTVNKTCGDFSDDLAMCSDLGCSAGCSGTFSCSGLGLSGCPESAGCTISCSGNADCSDIGSESLCTEAGCSWTGCSWHDAVEGRCDGELACSSITNRNQCRSLSRCRWRRGHCRNRRGSCAKIHNETNCDLHPGCSWIDGSDAACTGPSGCESYSNESDCENALTGECTGGTFSCGNLNECGTVSGCSEACEGTGTCSLDACYTDAGCTASCSGTISLSCSEISSRTKCQALGCSWTDSGSSAWRTVLIGGERGGGDVYFAIDVTDPEHPEIYWEYSVLRNLATLQPGATSGSFKAVRPFVESFQYENAKILPFSWSMPYVGRLDLPSDTCFYAEEESLAPLSSDPASPAPNPECWKIDANANNPMSGWFAIIGGGGRIYDRDDLPAPYCNYTDQTSCEAAACCQWNAGSSTCSAMPASSCDIREKIFKPFLLAIDIETGINAFQYLWPAVEEAFEESWPELQVEDNLVPYAMTSPIALDIWTGSCSDISNRKECIKSGCIWNDGGTSDVTDDRCEGEAAFGKDGYIDHLFVGDIGGLLWGIAFDDNSSSNAFRITLDTWETKLAFPDCSSINDETECVESGCWWDLAATECKEGYGTRYGRQPVSAPASAAIDTNKNLRIYFGTGKFEVVEADHSDRTDFGYSSFYNIALPLRYYTSDNDDVEFSINLSSLPNLIINKPSSANALKFDLETDILVRHIPHECTTDCTGSPENTGDKWIEPPHPDITRASDIRSGCQNSSECQCSGGCYSCILDLMDQGEKIINQPLIAGGLVFFTTFKPQSEVCSGGGVGYIYAVDYMCRPLTYDPFSSSGLASEELHHDDDSGGAGAYRANLGNGMPSKPVLDSSGEYLIIQTSDAKIHRIRITIQNPLYLKGWRESE